MPDSPFHLDYISDYQQICRTCGLNPRDHPIHCIRTTSPAPPYRSMVSPSLTPESLKIQPHRWPRLQPPRPALRFDVPSNAEKRPRVRARRSDFSPLSPATTINDVDFGRTTYTSGSSIPNTPVHEYDYTKNNKLGLRVPEVQLGRSTSPDRSPGGERLARAEKGEPVSTASPRELANSSRLNLWKRNAVKPWRIEILSWALSALCMCTIGAVLCLFQDRPLPKHWVMNITLNAYIAILSKAASAALMLPVSEALGQLKWSWFQDRSKKMSDFEMFDNASRGPWGSFLLLVRTKGTTLAALGALVTICAMVMDPFFQQVVRYPQRTVVQTKNSSIAKVTRIENHFYQRHATGGQIMTPEQDMTAVIEPYFSGFGVPRVEHGNGTRANIPFTCPTSDCIWESYETFGVCSECVDLVDMLDFGCYPTMLDWTQNSTQYVLPDYGAVCGWFFNATSDSRMLMLGYQVDPFNGTSGEILMTRALPLITNVSRRNYWGGAINFKHIRNPINNFVVVTPTEEPDEESILRNIFQHQKPRAIECVLSWCVKTMESSYHEGIYTETVKDRFINTTAGPYPWTVIPPDVPDPKFIGKMQYLQDITVDPRARDGQGNASSYGLSNDTAFNIIAIFDDYLPAFYIRKTNASKTFLKNEYWDYDPRMLEDPTNPWLAPNNVTDQMNRLAIAMTDIMRQWSNDTALGKSFSEETYVEVRWAWLALPITVLILTLVFLLGTMRRTSIESDRVGVWKNSAIVTLLYGLPDEMQWKLNASQHHKKPQSRAKELNVRLLPTKTWRMSGYILSPTSEKPKWQPN